MNLKLSTFFFCVQLWCYLTWTVHLISFLSSVWKACWAVFRATCHPSAVRFRHCSSSQSVWTWGWRTVRPSAVSSASWLTNWSFPAPWFRKDTYWAYCSREILLYLLKSLIEELYVCCSVILDSPVTEQEFLEQLHELNNKINFAKELSFRETLACSDIQDIVDRLKIKVRANQRLTGITHS